MYSCARVRACAHVCVFDEGESTMLRIFANSLIVHSLYTHDFSLIFSMWDFVSCFIFLGDVTFDSRD